MAGKRRAGHKIAACDDAARAHPATQCREQGCAVIDEIDAHVIKLRIIANHKLDNTIGERSGNALMRFNHGSFCTIGNRHHNPRVSRDCRRRDKAKVDRLGYKRARCNGDMQGLINESGVQSNDRVATLGEHAICRQTVIGCIALKANRYARKIRAEITNGATINHRDEKRLKLTKNGVAWRSAARLGKRWRVLQKRTQIGVVIGLHASMGQTRIRKACEGRLACGRQSRTLGDDRQFS